MVKKLYILYVPGLGDRNPTGQRLAVRTWRLWGVRSELLRMGWDDDEPWESKLHRLVDRIDALHQSGYAVGLVGTSAGASAVMNAYQARANVVAGCVLISGKVNHPEAIGRRYYQRNPAFVVSVQDCTASLRKLNPEQRARILSRYAIRDWIVSMSDSRIEGAHNQVVLSVGHAFTIATQIIFGAPSFLRFLKRLPRI